MFNNPEPKKDIENTPQFSYPIYETIRLPTPTIFPSVSFVDVIQNRKSSREFRELSTEQIGNLLWLACKVKDTVIDTTGYILTRRPSASAGARHPIDVLVSSPMLDVSTMYYYNPFEHSLNKLSLDKEQINALIAHANEAIQLKDAAIFWFLAHPLRTESKYDNAISLIWRDAGALIHSIQLACTLYGINSCAIGTLGEPYISNMFLKSGNVWSAGGIVIG
jgi:SagB-type dehydrogenase family enzyme